MESFQIVFFLLLSILGFSLSFSSVIFLNREELRLILLTNVGQTCR